MNYENWRTRSGIYTECSRGPCSSRGNNPSEAAFNATVDIFAEFGDHASMHFAKTWGTAAIVLGLGTIISACTGGPPEVPRNVTTVAARHDHDGTEVQLNLDTAKLLACLETSHSIPIGEAHKCKVEDSDYSVTLNDGATVITIHTFKQFTVDHQGFFTNDCLFPLLYKAAHGKDPEPSDC